MFASRWATACALFAVIQGLSAQTVQRCEGADKRVVYSNTECPAGTRAVRSVNTDPPVRVGEQSAAQTRAKKDIAEAARIDKQRASEEAQQKRAAAERSKAAAKAASACDRAKRELARARTERTALSEGRYTGQQMQKAEGEIARREQAVAKDCAG
jgi:acyl-CoA reductase-like NAD-dependent aldehyde dehydrogenase